MRLSIYPSTYSLSFSCLCLVHCGYGSVDIKPAFYISFQLPTRSNPRKISHEMDATIIKNPVLLSNQRHETTIGLNYLKAELRMRHAASLCFSRYATSSCAASTTPSLTGWTSTGTVPIIIMN
ncbi:hypothetical protein BDDG_04301 [Blastomyces dermatitidis ATCC 18188]|uniref:Uncharacterized protein n=1 Tax=Ajellomyces dermatitidis (strain ATCC 18188 / CBS 674.68) TaxID=653446 RepID=F2TDP6_AJEDA|nr:hypothetical protein BDDG_04301 [Blastomyces dermatitidis ATCC 18188]